MFITALSTIAKSWKEPRSPSTDDCIKKMWTIYTMEYYSAIKKNDFATFAATWTGLGDNAKQNKSSRERQFSYGFTYLWNIRSRKIGRRRKGRRKVG